MYMCVYVCMYVYINIYIYGPPSPPLSLFLLARHPDDRGARPEVHHGHRGAAAHLTPGLHNKIPALKIFARGWVAQ